MKQRVASLLLGPRRLALLFSLIAVAPACASDAAELAFQRGDYVRAAKLLTREANLGRPLAQTILGYAYQYGLGAPKSYEEAALWYRCAAEQGEPSAQFFLGQLYDRGQGVREDPVEAAMWLDLAAAQAPRNRRDYWATMRDAIGGKMSIDELTEARRRAVAWSPSYVCKGDAFAASQRLPTRKIHR